MRAITNKDGSITLTADNGADAYLLEPFGHGVKVGAYWQSAPVSTGDRTTTYPRMTIRPLFLAAREETTEPIQESG